MLIQQNPVKCGTKRILKEMTGWKTGKKKKKSKFKTTHAKINSFLTQGEHTMSSLMISLLFSIFLTDINFVQITLTSETFIDLVHF